MKKSLIILTAAVLFTGCYGDAYLMDYEYSAAYVAYQYDLRTFIPDEQVAVSFAVGLAGVVNNKQDRAINAVVDNSLLTADLSVFDSKKECSSFYAIDGFLGKGALGQVSQGYVTEEVAMAGISGFEALPENYYSLSGLDGMNISKGRHTADVWITPTEEMFKDEKILKPYYAIGFKVNSADVDKLVLEKSFQIMAIKIENRFYGNWYHAGKKRIINDKTGETLSYEYYDRLIPQPERDIYVLTTETANSVTTNKIANKDGSIRLYFNKDDRNTITVSDPLGQKEISAIPGQVSHHNGAKLIENREVYLNYKWSNGDGTSTYVTDTLGFRNRTRDGINEWQDENQGR